MAIGIIKSLQLDPIGIISPKAIVSSSCREYVNDLIIGIFQAAEVEPVMVTQE